MNMRLRRRCASVLSHGVLALLSAVRLLPFVLLVLQSFRSYLTEGGGVAGYAVPQRFSLDNYAYLLQDGQFFRWYGNTLAVGVVTALGQTGMVLCVSYALSRLRFRLRRGYQSLLVAVGMFPGFLTMIALYYLFKHMGLTQQGAVPGLMLLHVASAGIHFHIAKGFFDALPRSLEEAARMDGATRGQVFVRIMLPMARPVAVYTLLTGFMAPWGDYVFASYLSMGHTESYTVAVGLYRWVNTADYQGYFTRFCAGGVLCAVPVALLFMALERFYVEGVTAGAVKG